MSAKDGIMHDLARQSRDGVCQSCGQDAAMTAHDAITSATISAKDATMNAKDATMSAKDATMR